MDTKYEIVEKKEEEEEKDNIKDDLTKNPKKIVGSGNNNIFDSVKKESFLETNYTSRLLINNNNNSIYLNQKNESKNIFIPTKNLINIDSSSKVFPPQIFQDDNKNNPNNNSINTNQYENPYENQIQLQPVQIIKSNTINEPFNLQKNNMIPNYLYKDNILNSFKDQKQTIFLQQVLMGAKIEIIEFIVIELKGTYREIIKDKNGNYFCSDLIKVCDQKNRFIILEELSPNLAEDCLDRFATHSIQELIERSSSEIEYKYILCSFNDYNKFLFAALDPNGAYTIQKIVERIPERYRKEFNFIFTSFIGFTSKTKFGIVTVKKFISLTKNENVTSQMMNFIRNNFMNLASDQYANYLIQFLLEKWSNTNEGTEIKELVSTNFQRLCEKKYSSFICEIFIKIISPEEKKELINSLDLDYLIKSNNHHVMKILKALGISINQNNNSHLNLHLNNNNFIPNNFQNNNTTSRFFNFQDNNNYFANNNNNNSINNNNFNNNYNNYNNNNNNNNNNNSIRYEGFKNFHKKKK